jgi:hypothetical protein
MKFIDCESSFNEQKLSMQQRKQSTLKRKKVAQQRIFLKMKTIKGFHRAILPTQ